MIDKHKTRIYKSGSQKKSGIPNIMDISENQVTFVTDTSQLGLFQEEEEEH